MWQSIFFKTLQEFLRLACHSRAVFPINAWEVNNSHKHKKFLLVAYGVIHHVIIQLSMTSALFSIPLTFMQNHNPLTAAFPFHTGQLSHRSISAYSSWTAFTSLSQHSSPRIHPPGLTKARTITALAKEQPSQLFLFVFCTHVWAWHGLTHQNSSIIRSRSLYMVKRVQRVPFSSMFYILKDNLKLNIWGKNICNRFVFRGR